MSIFYLFYFIFASSLFLPSRRDPQRHATPSCHGPPPHYPPARRPPINSFPPLYPPARRPPFNILTGLPPATSAPPTHPRGRRDHTSPPVPVIPPHPSQTESQSPIGRIRSPQGIPGRQHCPCPAPGRGAGFQFNPHQDSVNRPYAGPVVPSPVGVLLPNLCRRPVQGPRAPGLIGIRENSPLPRPTS